MRFFTGFSFFSVKIERISIKEVNAYACFGD